jgi:ParB family chromosome partitioning protein
MTRTSRRRKKTARGRLRPKAERRGLEAAQVVIAMDAPEVAALATEVAAVGGAAVGAYREPLSGRAVLLAALPVTAVEPTPFQRDLSPTHAARLAAKIEEAGSFLDPLIVVRGAEGKLWTPNGRHRLAAARMLGLKQVMALVSPDEQLAFRILALNTEKAHNLRDRALEVIRMARALAARAPRAKEQDYTAEFEAPELLTLGLVYERHGRFADRSEARAARQGGRGSGFGGGAYHAFLKKVDRFSDKTLAASLRSRADYAARLEAIEAEVKRIIAGLQQRGFKSPYLRAYVVARINPVRFHKLKKGDTQPVMPIGAALTRMLAAAKQFKLDSVKSADLALVAAVAPDES